MLRKKNLLFRMKGCSISEIEEEINLLKPEIRIRLFKEYVLGNERVLCEEISSKDKDKNRYIVLKMKKNIEDKRNGINSNKMKYINFFERFKGFSKEEVMKAVSVLDTDDINLLKKKYGENFENTEINKNLTQKESNRINEDLIRKIKKILNMLKSGEYVVTSIEEQFPGISFEDILNAVNKLKSKPSKTNVYHLFGKDLKKKCLVKKDKKNSALTEKTMFDINKIIYKRGKHNSTFPTFISQFQKVRKEGETDEELLLRIKSEFFRLNKMELDILYRKYESDLQNTRYYGQFTTEENKMCIKIISKLRKLLGRRLANTKYYKRLIDYFDKLTPIEEVLYEISTLSFYEKEIMKIKFGESYLDIKEHSEVPNEVNKKIPSIIDKIYKRILKRREIKTGISLSYLRKIKHLLNSKEFIFLNNIYSLNIAACIIIEKYMCDVITIDSLSKLTNVSKKDILMFTKNYLLKTQEMSYEGIEIKKYKI